MVTQVTLGQDGQMSSTDAGGVQSSTQYKDTGVTVRSGLHSRTVSEPSQIADTDLVEIEGMQVTAKMARELGLMGQVFDADLSAGAAAKAAQVQTTEQQAQEDNSATGHAEFDQAVEGLNASIEAETMTLEEATEMHTALGEIALADMSVSEAVEMIDGINEGVVSPLEVGSDKQAMLQSVESKATAAATKSAQSELGAEGFERLSTIAQADPEVNAAIRSYAIMRATGKTEGITWNDFLADVEDHIRGGR